MTLDVQITDHSTAGFTNYDYWQWPTNNTIWYSSPSTVYLYQIFCPKPKCKTANWLELNKEKECTKCGSLLRAVNRKIDYEVEVE